MTKILDWRRSDDPRDVVHLAVQALVEGHVVAVPTQTCYVLVASGLCSAAVESLDSIAALPAQGPLAVVPRSSDESLDILPKLSGAARRLVRKLWPGPVILQHRNTDPFSSMRCLAPPVLSRLQPTEDRLRLWQPSHEVLHHIAKLVPGPLVCGLAPNRVRPGSPVAAIDELVAGQSVLAIDAGTVEAPGVPTVIELDGNQGRIVREGVAPRSYLRAQSQMVILFVCTGNTCRSPMAAALMRRKIATRFGGANPASSSRSDVPIIACSAGVSAYGGDPASHGALHAIRMYQASLDDHQSTQLHSGLVDQADLILAMGHKHRSIILAQWPEAASKVHLIASDGGEISDPFGGSLEVYQKCAEQLDRHTSYWIDQLDTDAVIQWDDA